MEIDIENLTGIYKNMTHGIVALVFRCTAKNRPLTEAEEAVAVAWHPVAQLGELMPPAYVVRVLDALASGSVPTRAHDGKNLLSGQD